MEVVDIILRPGLNQPGSNFKLLTNMANIKMIESLWLKKEISILKKSNLYLGVTEGVLDKFKRFERNAAIENNK